MDEIPYGKYIDSNINHDLPLSTEIIPYKSIKIDILDNISDRDIILIDTIYPEIQHAIVHTNQTNNKKDFIICKCQINPNIVKTIVISSFTISILFVFASPFFQ